jgi:signal transduction histidine kinase
MELDSYFIVADENRIEQVLSNLIDSAVKSNDGGAITISTEID